MQLIYQKLMLISIGLSNNLNNIYKIKEFSDLAELFFAKYFTKKLKKVSNIWQKALTFVCIVHIIVLAVKTREC